MTDNNTETSTVATAPVVVETKKPTKDVTRYIGVKDEGESKTLEIIDTAIRIFAADPSTTLSVPITALTIREELSGRWKRGSKELAEKQDSIEQLGQLESCVVKVEAGTLVLYAGFGRVMAIRALNDAGQSFPGGPNVHISLWRDDLDGFIAGLHTNLKRRNLSPIDLAKAVGRLEDGGMGRNEIAKQLKLNGSTITQHLKFRKLPERIQSLGHDGTLPFRALVQLTELETEADQLSVAEELVSEAEAEHTKRQKPGKAKVISRKATAKVRAKGGKAGIRSIAEVRKTFTQYMEDEETAGSRVACVFAIVLQYIDGKIGDKKLIADAEEAVRARIK